jgi:hypothetical protein
LQIKTTNTGSQLDIGRLKASHVGEYRCTISNVAGLVESLASLALAEPVDRGVAPDFKQTMQDLRVVQTNTATFVAVITGTPEPQISWFKVRFFSMDSMCVRRFVRMRECKSKGDHKIKRVLKV